LRHCYTTPIFSLTLTRRLVDRPDLVFAYLDPVSGSIVLQALIAGVLGGLLTMKRTGFAVREAWSRFVKRIKG